MSRGEILAVMGPSGSGKSTLTHCLAGIFTPDRGEVWFDSQRLDRLSETRRTELRRTAFGFVFQFGQLVPELTAVDNVALPLLLNKHRRRDAYAQAHQWFPRLGLDGLAGRRVGELAEARRSGSRSRGRSSPGRLWSSPTSRPGRWTRWPVST